MVRVFCDFDGTVCTKDVGNQLFRTYVGEQAVEIVQGYLSGAMTARTCLVQECAAVNGLSEREFERFVDQFSVDPYFPQFVEFCSAKGLPVTILSDGLDAYVARILKNNGLGHIPFFANHVDFLDGRLVVSFPHTDSECEQCGNCKRNHMLTMSGDDDILVFAGDGLSDRCPARYADVVFAKRSLIEYCQEQNISYHEFNHFGEVQARLEVLLQQKRIKHRREAMMARREVFMQG